MIETYFPADFGGEFTSGFDAMREIAKIRQQLETVDHLPRYPKMGNKSLRVWLSEKEAEARKLIEAKDE